MRLFESTRYLLLASLLTILTILLSGQFLKRGVTKNGATLHSQDATEGRLGVEFVDITTTAGVTFQHMNGASGRKYLPETMGAGVAFFDYDGDQALDIYMLNGAALPGYDTSQKATNVLYRNNRDGTFTDVSIQAGVNDTGYGMGCAAADYDNDGDLDLYITNFGPNVLYRNNGDGTFTNVTTLAGVGDTSWSTGCTFFDYDNDGDLDLYVVNYVHDDLTHYAGNLAPYLMKPESYAGKDIKAYPHPRNFPGVADILYRNEGNSRFTDVTTAAGLVDTVETEGKGLGVVATDYNNDGYRDIYVANDGGKNFLYRNNKNGTFTEVGAISGVAYGQDGQREAGMGCDAGDYDNDGNMDIVVTNFEMEPVSLYHNEGNGFFSYASFASGIGLPSLRYLSFGTGFIDYDNDGYQDVFIANGHVLDNIGLFDQSTTYEQQNLLLHNDGPDQHGRYRFSDVSHSTGPGIPLAKASRGCAFGDYDNDGDTDILVANCGQPATLLRNDGGNVNNWVTIRPVGTTGNRDGIGARIEVRSGTFSQAKEVKGSYSYLSQNDMRVNFGLGRSTSVDLVQIRWSGGKIEQFQDIPANRFLTIVEGKGIVETRVPETRAQMVVGR